MLAQDTGLEGLVPTGRGLVTFTTLDQAAAGAEAIMADHAGHAADARDLAESCYGSDLVLTRLLDNLAAAA